MVGKKKSEPQPITSCALAMMFFTKPNKPLGYGKGFAVRFAVPPKVGDLLNVTQDSIKRISEEELHITTWKVVDVSHEVNLDDPEYNEATDLPIVSLRVTVHPAELKKIRK